MIFFNLYSSHCFASRYIENKSQLLCFLGNAVYYSLIRSLHADSTKYNLVVPRSHLTIILLLLSGKG
ncbi:Hypothetical predicted protein [Olea europaea subsp. europaea]|uniref:Uncharacterized protein n=1 Tax=Olea europaea subsp. europaea TaxID=158383 RepID=A0A8S0PVD4_OLEEU|nr:Hypothetical predicted protein [Olea europaea subsp. europaea]